MLALQGVHCPIQIEERHLLRSARQVGFAVSELLQPLTQGLPKAGQLFDGHSGLGRELLLQCPIDLLQAPVLPMQTQTLYELSPRQSGFESLCQRFLLFVEGLKGSTVSVHSLPGRLKCCSLEVQVAGLGRRQQQSAIEVASEVTNKVVEAIQAEQRSNERASVSRAV